MNTEEQKTCLIMVFIAEFDFQAAKNRYNQIKVQYEKYIKSGLLELITPPLGFYPDFSKLTYENRSKEREKWLSKQNLDNAFLMNYSKDKGNYYLLLEDDVVTKPGFITLILKFIESKSDKHWFMMNFCSLSIIGNLYKMKDVESMAKYLINFYNVFPVDWLMQHYLFTKFCPPHQVNKIECQKKLTSKYVFSYRPSLFQHLGYWSSLKGKVQKLKDKTF